jgi:amino acid adenylation domain-containing protein
MGPAAKPESESLDGRIAGLAPRRRELLEQMLRRKREDAAQASSIPRREPSNVSPLSFAQRRIWFLDQLMPGSPFYNESTTFRLSFPLDTTVLERCLNEIIRRHEILRTTFHTVDGDPVQSVAPELTIAMPVTDLRHLPVSEREQEARRLGEEQAGRSMDLSTGPLIQGSVMRLADDDCLIVLTLHHIVCDGWSMIVFFRELSALYDAFAAGQRSPLPELPIQYADFAVWQRKELTGELLEQDLSYWRTQLADLPVLQLPTDRPRPAAQTFRGAIERLAVSEDVTAQLRELGNSGDATLFMTLLAAFQVLLYHYCGQTDIVVGAPIASRNRPELEPLIGFFVNSLVMRTRLEGDPTFREVVARVRQTAIEAFSHQDLPFERLVEELRPDRDMSRNPLFQVIFQVFNDPSSASGNTPGQARGLAVESHSAKFDLQLDFYEAGAALTATLEYSTDVFDRPTIVRFAEHLVRLLGFAAAHPDRRISEIPLLTREEQEQMLVSWNATATEYPRDACIHQLFEEQVARAPESVALLFGGERLTYGELNRRANRLAHSLVAKGVGADTLVAVSIDRSPAMIVALLGILKAGGAYVPLDPSYPQARIAFVISDAGIRHAVTERTIAEHGFGPDVEVIALDGLLDYPDANLGPRAGAEDLAYVMHTSGSTGMPKGVAVPHRAVIRLVRSTNYISISCVDVFLQFAPLSFDASTFEIWGPLLNGARLVLAPPYLPSLVELGRTILENQVTVLWLTAALFHQMVNEQLESLRGLRQLLAGGDVLSAPQVLRAARELQDCHIVNGYGPTENTTFTTTWWIRGEEGDMPSVPIGRPIANTRVYVLDSRANPVPVGVVGELFVAGDGLARGYLRQEELTAEKFVRNHLACEPGDQLYRTGDLVRYRADGCIEFLGRIDQQVKIRGFRIEPGEIEAVLLDHPAVKECAVIPREDVPGERRLVAYVVPDPSYACAAATAFNRNGSTGSYAGPPVPKDEMREPVGQTGEPRPLSSLVDPPLASAFNQKIVPELRGFLRQRLPEFMIPSAFVDLDRLPVSAHGKVDRHAFPAPGMARPEGLEEFAVTRTNTERAIADIWMQVLGLAGIGAEDNFFDLGGHSLLATQVVSRIRSQFGLELPLRKVFEMPTVSGLARAVEECQEQQAGNAPVPALSIRAGGLDVDQLSDDDVDLLLKGMLSQGEEV